MNDAKAPRLLYLLLALVLLNIGMTGYLIYNGNAHVPAGEQAAMGEQVPKEQAMALAKKVVQRYNDKDLDGLYAEFSDVARMQFTKEKLRETVDKLHSVAGRVDDFAYSHSAIVGNQDGKQFKTLFFKLRLSGGSMPVGEMKITVAVDGKDLPLYGFFINATQP
jgi:hypothetical protein